MTVVTKVPHDENSDELDLSALMAQLGPGDIVCPRAGGKRIDRVERWSSDVR
jgi:hypothetical protein